VVDDYAALANSLAGFGRTGLDPNVGTYSTAESGHRVGGFSVADCPDEGLTSWSTVGTNRIDTGYRTASGKMVTAEFIGCAGSGWDRFGTALAFCTFFVADGGPSRYGTVVRGAFQHAGEGVSTPHGFIVAPFCWPETFPSVEDDDTYTVWLQLVPITAAEALHAEQHGGDALENVFEERQPDLFDLRRTSLL